MSSLAALLHDDNDRIVISGSKRLPDGNKAWFNRSVRNVEQADNVAAEIAATGRNAHCKHGLHDGTLNESRRPDCHAKHFPASRTFFIDIDVGHGDEQHYATMEEAAPAFKKANVELRKLGLPVPNVVQLTGGGIQAVWVTVDPYPGDEWRKLMGILSLLTKRCGLLIDMSMTAIDKAVRYCGPGFMNVNHGAPRPTKVMRFNDQRIVNQTFTAVLMQYGTLRSVKPEPAKHFNDRFIPKMDEFTLDLSVIVDECKVLQEAVLTGGEKHGYRHWTNLLGLISKNEDEEYGRVLAHEASKAHPGYDRETVDNKFDGFRNSSVKGYTTCSTFGQVRSDLCTTCTYYGKIYSPAGIQGKIVAVATARGQTQTVVRDDDRILDGMYFNSDIGIRRRKRGEETSDPLIWPAHRVEDLTLRTVDSNRQQQYLCFDVSLAPSNNGCWTRAIEIEVPKLANFTSIARVLADQQAPVIDRYHKGVAEAMNSWLSNLRQQGRRVAYKYSRIGWTHSDNSFVLGSFVYRPDGTHEPIFNPEPGLLNHDAHGTFEEYQVIADTIMAHEVRPEAHALLAASLGAPLLHLVGAPGIALNFYSPTSAHGKSTIADLAGSFWGAPKTLKFVLDDTINSVLKRISILNNLPAIYDDMRTDADGQAKIIDYLFRLTSMVEKSRLTANSTVQDRGDWRTAMIITSNYNFTDIVRADRKRGGEAAVARVMDFPMPPLPEHSNVNTAQILMAAADLERFNGFIGHYFIQWAVTHQDLIKERVSAWTKHLMARTGVDLFGRFHATAGAVMLTAAQIIHKKGYFNIDPKLVEIAVLSSISHGRKARKDTAAGNDPQSALREFLRFYEANKYAIIKLSPNSKVKKVDLSGFLPRTPIMYEIDKPDGCLRVSAVDLQQWLMERGYDTFNIMKALRETGATQVRPFGMHTDHCGVPISMLIFPLTGDFAGMAI